MPLDLRLPKEETMVLPKNRCGMVRLGVCFVQEKEKELVAGAVGNPLWVALFL